MEDQHCTSQLQPARAGAFLGGKIISLTELGRAEFLLSSELTLFALNTNITDGATILCHPDYRGVISLYSETVSTITIVILCHRAAGQHANYPAHQYHPIHEGSDFYVDL